MPTTSLSCTEIYEGIAPIYDRLQKRFLRFSGGSAQAAFEAVVTTLLKPNMTILDAACGTGRLARHLLSLEPSVQITLLDAAPAMLQHSCTLQVRRIHGSLGVIPLDNESVDLVTCAWSIETVPDAVCAVSDLFRIVRPGGHLCLVFCAQNTSTNLLDRFFIRSIKLRKTGIFLDPESIEQSLIKTGRCRIRRMNCVGPVAVILAEKLI